MRVLVLLHLRGLEGRHVDLCRVFYACAGVAAPERLRGQTHGFV